MYFFFLYDKKLKCKIHHSVRNRRKELGTIYFPKLASSCYEIASRRITEARLEFNKSTQHKYSALEVSDA